MKPRLFIGSSVEGLKIAKAIEIDLKHDFHVTLWPYTFNVGSTALEDLLEQLNKSDFGIFVFSADDTTLIRNEEYAIARDNVLYELGLYTGKLGRKNTFIAVPSNKPGNFHLPSDLSGISVESYDSSKLDNLPSAVSTFCTKISQQVFNAKYALTGKWIFSWEVKDSENYPEPVTDEVDVFHYENQIKFIHKISTDENYLIQAELSKTFLTGTWGDVRKIGYDGVFQMKLNGKGDAFKGIWSGWRTDGGVDAGPCSLIRVQK